MEGINQEVPEQEEMLDFYQKLRKKISASLESRGAGDVNSEKSTYSKFVDYLAVLPDMFHLGIKLLFDGNVPSENKGAIVAGLVYVISPIDLIPDGIPIAGWVDDLIVMVMAINKFLDTDNLAVAEAVKKHWAGEGNVYNLIKHIIDILDEAAEFLPKKLMKLIKDLFRK